MTNVNVKELETGMILADDVRTNSGQIVATKGTELNNKLIARLDFYSIKSVLIDDSELEAEAEIRREQEEEERKRKEEAEREEREREEAEAIGRAILAQRREAEEIEKRKEAARLEAERKAKEEEEKRRKENREKFNSAGNASYSQKLKRSDEFKDFQLEYTKAIVGMQTQFKHYIATKEFDPEALIRLAKDILNSRKMTTIQLFDMLHNMRGIDDSIYAHCLNVGLMARALGKWLKLEKEDIEMLTLAGLLHDIGKAQIPDAILNKPGKLSDAEFQVIKMHSQLGHDLLRDAHLPDKVMNAVLSHHERCDGSGYPRGLKGSELDDFTMVIAIADVYDAMTAARPYRPPLCAFTAIENFEKEGLQKYRPHVVMTFLERIANAYQNSRVQLSDGRTGQIVMLNSKHLSRPMIQLAEGDIVDLYTEKDVEIVRIL